MAFTELHKIEVLKGKIRYMFDADNPEFDEVTTIQQLRDYIQVKLNPAMLVTTVQVEIAMEITKRRTRIVNEQKQIKDLDEFSVEIDRIATK